MRPEWATSGCQIELLSGAKEGEGLAKPGSILCRKLRSADGFAADCMSRYDGKTRAPAGRILKEQVPCPFAVADSRGIATLDGS